MKVKVELWSTEPAAVAAVRATIAGLPGGGVLVEEDGAIFLEGTPFLVWACEKQGYIRAVVGSERDPQ